MFKKLLRDYPFRKWMEAADSCEYCHAPFQVRVTYVDETGCFGDVEIRISHRPECPELYETSEQESTVFDIAGWEYMDKPFKLAGRTFLPFKARANVAPCLNCGRLVATLPVIMFIEGGREGELNFCQKCFKHIKVEWELKEVKEDE